MNTGSTAGAGSGEFHVYRHNKRREETRLEFLEKQKQVDEKKELFDLRMQTAQREAEEKTSKNRKKRYDQTALRVSSEVLFTRAISFAHTLTYTHAHAHAHQLPPSLPFSLSLSLSLDLSTTHRQRAKMRKLQARMQEEEDKKKQQKKAAAAKKQSKTEASSKQSKDEQAQQQSASDSKAGGDDDDDGESSTKKAKAL